MFPPKEVLVKADDNILELKSSMSVTTTQKEKMYIYSYTRSKTKEGTSVNVTESDLKKLLKSGNFQEIIPK